MESVVVEKDGLADIAAVLSKADLMDVKLGDKFHLPLARLNRIWSRRSMAARRQSESVQFGLHADRNPDLRTTHAVVESRAVVIPKPGITVKRSDVFLPAGANQTECYLLVPHVFFVGQLELAEQLSHKPEERHAFDFFD